MVTCSPEKFTEWFNDKYPGVYRKVVTDDVKDMTGCGLLYRHGYYVGLIKFNSRAAHLCEPTKEISHLEISMRGITATGSTNMIDAIRMAHGNLRTFSLHQLGSILVRNDLCSWCKVSQSTKLLYFSFH